ncbi:MAG: hypothetical protein K6F68_04240 [Clostridiales bacterium]|nr:hypothetical protein [Clostridiales bacterium]
MKLFSIGGTEIKCSPFLLAFVPLAALLGGFRALAAAFISLLAHECAHAMAAARLGYPVRSVEIQPFGFVARLDCAFSSRADAAAIYAAGPLASLSMAALSSLFEEFFPVYRAAGLGLTEFNLALLLVNLLPAMPLDGGRLIYAACSSRGKKPAMHALRALGAITGAGFIAAFGLLLYRGAFNVTFLAMGIFLILSALTERSPESFPAVRRERLNRRRPLNVTGIAVPADTTVARALELLPPGGYAVLTVIGKGGERVAEIDEKELEDAAVGLGAMASIGEAVAFSGGKSYNKNK